MVVPVFNDPSRDVQRGKTDYLFVTGVGTLFESGKKVTMTDCLDGLANVMTVVEVQGSADGLSIGWAEPRDLDISQSVKLAAGNHPGGNLVLFADGSVRFMEKDLLSRTQVRARATIAGGEPLALSPERFAEVLKSLRAETFDTGKLSFIRSLESSQGFTSLQVRQLLEDFDFDNDRVDAAVLLHPHVVDPENFFMVLEAFTFDDGRRKVRERLKMQ
jgi:prepilin-type processing-associated H-X9-DG protein